MTKGRAAGLFLDLDGTLADSLAAMRAAYERFLGHFAMTGGEAEFARLNGPPLPGIVAVLARSHGLADPPEQLTALYRGLIAEAYREVVPNAGAVDLLRSARGAGFHIAVVTSNGAALARAWLERAGLNEEVDCVVGGDDVHAGKPDPAPYCLALARTGCTAAKSLAVEDSPTGARAATAAGLRTVLLSTDCTEPPPGVTVVNGLGDVIAHLG